MCKTSVGWKIVLKIEDIFETEKLIKETTEQNWRLIVVVLVEWFKNK